MGQRETDHEQWRGRGRERERERENPKQAPDVGLDPMTLESRPELKSRVRHFGKASWCGHSGKQYGGSSKNYK